MEVPIFWIYSVSLSFMLIAASIAQNAPETDPCPQPILAQCQCGDTGIIMDVYAKGCLQEGEVECRPCVGVCDKFLRCSSCSLEKCLTCPNGSSGDFCEDNDFLAIEEEFNPWEPMSDSQSGQNLPRQHDMEDTQQNPMNLPLGHQVVNIESNNEKTGDQETIIEESTRRFEWNKQPEDLFAFRSSNLQQMVPFLEELFPNEQVENFDAADGNQNTEVIGNENMGNNNSHDNSEDIKDSKPFEIHIPMHSHPVPVLEGLAIHTVIIKNITANNDSDVSELALENGQVNNAVYRSRGGGDSDNNADGSQKLQQPVEGFEQLVVTRYSEDGLPIFPGLLSLKLSKSKMIDFEPLLKVLFEQAAAAGSGTLEENTPSNSQHNSYQYNNAPLSNAYHDPYAHQERFNPNFFNNHHNYDNQHNMWPYSQSQFSNWNNGFQRPYQQDQYSYNNPSQYNPFQNQYNSPFNQQYQNSPYGQDRFSYDQQHYDPYRFNNPMHQDPYNYRHFDNYNYQDYSPYQYQQQSQFQDPFFNQQSFSQMPFAGMNNQNVPQADPSTFATEVPRNQEHQVLNADGLHKDTIPVSEVHTDRTGTGYGSQSKNDPHKKSRKKTKPYSVVHVFPDEANKENTTEDNDKLKYRLKIKIHDDPHVRPDRIRIQFADTDVGSDIDGFKLSDNDKDDLIKFTYFETLTDNEDADGVKSDKHAKKSSKVFKNVRRKSNSKDDLNQDKYEAMNITDDHLFRVQRKVDEDNKWCPIKRTTRHADLDCTLWSYQKICEMQCHEGFRHSAATFRCARRKNEWEPELTACVPDKKEEDERLALIDDGLYAAANMDESVRFPEGG